MDSSSSSRKKQTKLSVRNRTSFKNPSVSSSLLKRRKTIFTKAYELSTLCEIDLCVICYGRDGELTTWPENQTKVRDMAERFSKLSDKERHKKHTNLSEFLLKKIKDEKKTSLKNNDNKFSEKVLEIEASLKSQLGILQDRLRCLNPNDQIENCIDSSGFVTHPSPPPSTENLPTDLFTPSNFSILLYNHDNATFTKLADSTFQSANNLATGFDYSNLLLGAQEFGGFNNFDDLPMVIPSPPQMQTQNPLLHFGQYEAWNQTPSFGVPMMFPSCV